MTWGAEARTDVYMGLVTSVDGIVPCEERGLPCLALERNQRVLSERAPRSAQEGSESPHRRCHLENGSRNDGRTERSGVVESKSMFTKSVAVKNWLDQNFQNTRASAHGPVCGLLRAWRAIGSRVVASRHRRMRGRLPSPDVPSGRRRPGTNPTHCRRAARLSCLAKVSSTDGPGSALRRSPLFSIEHPIF
jgi:hypothetical protein